ncbi:splicing factor U2AF 65 kDa subunit [Fistulifera solaris]|uniref:Splicing factor U2AF 65 kDa subunit n=1 Tax=Fistulifera solaris TaxID=1519565 RepID=A0A1Z5JSW5_FISSO|nr:splicing factor U2AF 65 kDa subunit [Fistulifera solaris]|eukprot:GAX17029.1 splicing factor U2AF 65 kDa subunit [Fistulifera solaris]
MSYSGGPPPRGWNDGPPRRGPPPPHHHHRGPPPMMRGGRGPPRRGPRRSHHPTLIPFRSYEEERDWVEDRRRKRFARTSKFDQLPQAASTSFIIQAVDTSASQQTRHARRLYVGNIPVGVTEALVQETFTQAIHTALVEPWKHPEQPIILSVYINRERQYCFIEFTTVEITTACMALDGMMLQGQAVKIKRPNDYNPLTAPKVHPSALPELDVSRLGIVATTVMDGPNKIFIGGLHYHLQDAQVLELLQAFGKVKAFHLVKNEGTELSKGYCFVEYADPSITPIAVQGLNGMDIGGGKCLTARLAGERSADMPGMPPDIPVAPPVDEIPLDRTIVTGYDVEALVDAAMGLREMPSAPQFYDAMGQPLTRIVATTIVPIPSRILMLRNMVTDDDLASEEATEDLKQEVGEECSKFGNLLAIEVHERLIYLEYENLGAAVSAQRELQGRQFGDAAVEASFVTEDEYAKVKRAN